MQGIVRAWGKILAGYQPNLSIEITRECPLTCPGCYAYGSGHLGGNVTLRELQDYKGQPLIDAIFSLPGKYRPLHVSIVGGEPLVRYRELNKILPRMAKMGIYAQVVTSAIRQIPPEWVGLKRLQIVVSIDGLQPEHDERRKPATYERILRHIEGARSPPTVPLRGNTCGGKGISRSSRNSGRRIRTSRRSGSACIRRRWEKSLPSG